MALGRGGAGACGPLISKPDIRPLSEDEVTARIEAFIEVARDVDGEYWGRQHFLKPLTDKWKLSLAAWAEKRPVGYAILSRKSSIQAHLHHFMVAKDQRGQRLGERLLAMTIERCIEQGFTEITLKIAPSNFAAWRFYKLHGFANTGQDNGYDVMRRALSP